MAAAGKPTAGEQSGESLILNRHALRAAQKIENVRAFSAPCCYQKDMPLAPAIRRKCSRKPNHASPGPVTGSRSGLPLFLSGTTKRTGRNYGSVTGSPRSQETVAESEEVSATSQDIPAVSGQGIEAHAVAYGLTLNGRTDATYSSTFETQNAQAARAQGCGGCGPENCIQVTGTLVSSFQVTTQVTLPGVSDYPDLTHCQRQRVQNAITSVLAPHEQQHVAAFQTYIGMVNTPFSLTLCRSDLDARVQSLHDALEARRRTATQARSDALDPFNFTVDLDCHDPTSAESADAEKKSAEAVRGSSPDDPDPA
jgi:hypothetical protein